MDHAEILWRRVHRFRWLLSAMPFVRMIAVCNSLAAGRATAASDIDLFVVTADDHLYTARFFLKFITQIFGVRVHHQKKAGRFCLSFFVSERAMNLAPIALEFDPHLAEFIQLMQPICGEALYKKFRAANEGWMKGYQKLSAELRIDAGASAGSARFFQWILEKTIGFLGAFPERFFRKIQMKKDRARAQKCAETASIIMTDDMYKFHENDPREKIAQKIAAASIKP